MIIKLKKYYLNSRFVGVNMTNLYGLLTNGDFCSKMHTNYIRKGDKK